MAETSLIDGLHREPDGRPQNLIWLGAAALMLGLFAYWPLVHGASPTWFVLTFAVMFGIGGIAESLPAEQTELAAGLRVLAIVVATILAGTALVGFLGGPDLLL